MIGGKFAERVIRQCDLLGFDGDIWAVNPHRDEMQSRACFRTLQDLPEVPDAAFIAVPNHQTVELVGELSAMKAGGAVCYASGFAEIGGEGIEYQKRLNAAMGDMPLIGPNCYGVLNYQDGVALWPDEQGGVRCRRGVAIISQSGNITVSLTMQRRGVPVAYLISTGNMAGVRPHDYIRSMLDNPDITAIGLYLEGVVDAREFSIAALEALEKRKPIVVLESGQSAIGARVARTHSYSLSPESRVSRAFYGRYGIIQVKSIPELLETLKFVSIIPPSESRMIASISCSGGEAALMADLAAEKNLEFAEFSDRQSAKLNAVLGEKVVVSNPLDYHTYIWGNQRAQTECFQAVYEGSQNLTVNVIDCPMEGVCDPLEWDYAIRAITNAKDESGSNVVVVSTLHENLPLKYQAELLKHNIPPMFGMVECINAIAASVEYAVKTKTAKTLAPLINVVQCQGIEILATEFEGKQQLRAMGLPVVAGVMVQEFGEAITAATHLGYPVVAKMSSRETIHKSEADGVILGIHSEEELRKAYESISQLSGEVLIERQLPAPIAELLVGIRVDAIFGPIMVIGSGGKLANLIEDSAVLHFPIFEHEVEACLNQLKIGRLLSGFRGPAGDIDAVLEFIMNLAKIVDDEQCRHSEIEINPLFVYTRGTGVVAVDVVYRNYQ